MCLRCGTILLSLRIQVLSMAALKQTHAKYLLFYLFSALNQKATSQAAKVFLNGSYFDIRQLCKEVTREQKS